MPGVWVFPGGAVDDADFGAEGDDELDADEHAHRVCAVRELARGGRDRLSMPRSCAPGRAGSPPSWSRSASTRASTSRSRRPTPRPSPTARRPSTRGWFEPREALERHRAGELKLVFPTIKHLESLLPYATAEEALAAVTDLPPVARPAARRRRGRRAAGRAPGRARLRRRARGLSMSRGVLTIQIMTSSLPQDVRDVFERFITTRVHDRRRAPAADHLARHPVLQPGRGDDRRHDRARLPEEGRRREPQPARLAALLRPDRARAATPAAASSSRAPPRSTTATSTPTASATCASRARSCRRRRRCTRRSRCAGC